MRLRELEKGYIVILAVYLALMITIAAAGVYCATVNSLNRQIAEWNYELLQQGFYTVVPYYMADYSIFNWSITAESAALATAAAAQAAKKKQTNVFEHGEAWIDRYMDDPAKMPYVIQLVQTLLQTNQNNN